MNREIPGLLWIAIVSLGIMVLGKVLVAVTSNPVVLVDAVLSGILLVGIVRGQKWAYVLTFVAVAFGTVVGLRQGAEAGLAILVLGCLVLLPVLVCTSYFFPQAQPSLVAGSETGD